MNLLKRPRAACNQGGNNVRRFLDLFWLEEEKGREESGRKEKARDRWTERLELTGKQRKIKSYAHFLILQ